METQENLVLTSRITILSLSGRILISPYFVNFIVFHKSLLLVTIYSISACGIYKCLTNNEY